MLQTLLVKMEMKNYNRIKKSYPAKHIFPLDDRKICDHRIEVFLLQKYR